MHAFPIERIIFETAEGVETADECRCLVDLGVHLLQGYHFSKPLFEACAHPGSLNWPA